MTTATVRDLRYAFPAIRQRLKKGEEIGITLRGKLIGKLVPAEPLTPETVQWPDITKRLREVHGDKMFDAVEALIEQRKTER